VFLQRAVVGGTDIEITAVQDDTGAVARGQIRPGITATGAKIIARGADGHGGKIDIQSDEGARTNAYANVMSHSWGGSNYGARWEVVEFEPTVLLGKNVRIGGGNSEIRGTIVNAKEFTDNTSRMIIGVNKQVLRYESWARRRSLFKRSSMHHFGWREEVAPSVLQVESLVSTSDGSLEFESVIAENVQKMLIQKPIFRETSAVARSHDVVRTSSSGLSFGRCSLSDPLYNAFQRLKSSPNPRAAMGSAITFAANLIGTVDDARQLYGAVTARNPASVIAGTLARRCVSAGISFGSTKTETTTDQAVELPNHINAGVIRLECPVSVQLKGEHVAEEFMINTGFFKAEDMVSTTIVERTFQSTAVGLDLIAAAVGTALLPQPGAIAGGKLGRPLEDLARN
jgi:hypothetical protein